MLGYTIVGLALLLIVQAKNVYPQLLLARMFFSIGGAATATMVTAILPSMTAPRTILQQSHPDRATQPASRHVVSPSISSELTITPARLLSQESSFLSKTEGSAPASSPTRLAGFVGLFTGCGALLALGLFLPLPAHFQDVGTEAGQAVADSYYIVGAVSFMIAAICFFGLRNLCGETKKGWRAVLKTSISEVGAPSTRVNTSYWKLLLDSVGLGYQNPLIALGYLGGFVARASSVGISLFIPLFVNAYFISSGLCNDPERDSGDVKAQCRGAYILAAKLTGVSQMIALIFAPVFGYLADRYRHFNTPLLAAAIAGIFGYCGFAVLDSPEYDGIHGSPWIFLFVALLGISQIGAIVCSLGLLGRCILGLEAENESSEIEGFERNGLRDFDQLSSPNVLPTSDSLVPRSPSVVQADVSEENRALLGHKQSGQRSLNHLKGSIAGVYSLAGGAGILLLTKLGGLLFDDLSPSAPFYMLALFNGLLLLFGIASGISERFKANAR